MSTTDLTQQDVALDRSCEIDDADGADNVQPDGNMPTDAFCPQIDQSGDSEKDFVARPAATRVNGDNIETSEAVQQTGPTLDDVIAAQDEIKQQQSELYRLFESRIHSDEVQARALERLHGELKDYKQNFLRQEMMPVFKDVVFCHDVIAKELERMRDEPSHCSDDSPGSPLQLVGQMLLDLLFKHEVEPFRGETDQFDRKLQQCVGTQATQDEQLDKKVAKHGLTGFRTQDRIIRREQVTVYKYQPP